MNRLPPFSQHASRSPWPDGQPPDLRGSGRGDTRWRSWRLPETWPALTLPDGPLVAVSAHPDDVVLAIGGLLRMLAARGQAVTLVAVTDGEASHPHSRRVTPAGLARRRVEEDHAAFRALGVTLADEVRLGLPDGTVAREEDHLSEVLAAHLGAQPLLLAPWEHDGHPDHDASGRAALRAAASTGSRCWRYPVWAWHWAEPALLAEHWVAPVRVDLAAEATAAKRAAVAAYRSQTLPLGPDPADAAVVPPAIRAHFERDWETVLT
jgi:LmbE family N-acetylglucosaminyl deacetylase